MFSLADNHNIIIMVLQICVSSLNICTSTVITLSNEKKKLQVPISTQYYRYTHTYILVHVIIYRQWRLLLIYLLL